MTDHLQAARDSLVAHCEACPVKRVLTMIETLRAPQPVPAPAPPQPPPPKTPGTARPKVRGKASDGRARPGQHDAGILVQLAKGPAGLKAVAERQDLMSGVTHYVLQRLLRDGQIRSDGHGVHRVYSLPKKASAPAPPVPGTKVWDGARTNPSLIGDRAQKSV
jgi:hypothetical protein